MYKESKTKREIEEKIEKRHTKINVHTYLRYDKQIKSN